MFNCIMCTLTAAQIEDAALVRALYDAGMRIVRINTAHLSDTDQLRRMVSKLRSTIYKLVIIIDTKGPEMRTTATADDSDITLTDGAVLSIRGTADDLPTSAECIHVNYPLIHTEVRSGHTMLIDDGKMMLTVTDVTGDTITARVTRGGILGSRKGVSVSGVDLNLPAVSPRDRMFIRYAALSDDIDAIMHSFVRSPADVRAVQEAMGIGYKHVIAKIENHQGVEAISEIVKVADSILIARGDLTASIGADAVPQAQADIAKAARDRRLLIYLATNILPSMMSSPIPSAEDIEGIRLAVSQGINVMVLTNETAAGAYPVETVTALNQTLQSLAT